MPTAMQDYLFDLKGYLVLENAVDPAHVEAINAAADAMLPVEDDEWRGHVHCQAKGGTTYLRQVFEAGEPFERLIDHPAWIDHVTRYVGGDDGLFIDQGWYNLREPGGASSLHSGAHKRRIRTQFRYHDGQFRCGQINILLALNDVGPDDGPTMVVPGSHKSNLIHPAFGEKAKSLDGMAEAVKVCLKAGDALLFVDCIAHGSAERKTPGRRRVLVYRYGPHWGHSRNGYEPSDALLDRLTPERRRIIQPIPPRRPPRDS